MKKNNFSFCLWYDEEAPKINENSPSAHTRLDYEPDIGWERWSLPIGNGYFGANVFGRTETERIQITEKTLLNPPMFFKDEKPYFVGGLNSFSETYIDFGHKVTSDYVRYLDLKTAISGVEYTCNGVKYTREYFVSYPHKALVIRLDADKEGALSFTLRPTIPYKQSFGGYRGDGVVKNGAVTSEVKNGIGYIELSGALEYYGIDFLGVYRVCTMGGKIETSSAKHTYTDNDGTVITESVGTIKVSGADSAYIIVTLGSDYELSSDVFTSEESNLPTHRTTLDDTKVKVEGYMTEIENAISGKSYDDAYALLKDSHVSDYKKLFDRVSLNLGIDESDAALTTDELLEKYKNGTHSSYLETLLFQYGRYLLISSSREGTLPANLQGVWNTYNMPPWACDYTHNINVEMNYWPAFSTNLAETFKAYVSYNEAYMNMAKLFADELIKKYNPASYGKDGGNGWVVGDHTTAYRYASHRSAGNIGFMTQVFWEWYSYTKDPDALKYVYTILVDAARYITKCVELDENGKYLVQNCDSPEMYVNGVWYYTSGTTYAQSFAYLNNYNALEAARALGIDLNDEELLSKEEYSILKTVIEQLDKYDPINVGLSGQIKEFREEDYYCSLGDEPKHRHTSQLVGLYPGDLINSTTPAWLDAAKVTLYERGDRATGWGVAFKLNLWARTKDGNKAHKLLNALLTTCTATNLWDLHPPFQIDGNFGATAGISEMLLQSHEGYIAPLAAIPCEWHTGSFSGLVARGSFEVSAIWKNGCAESFTVISKSGGTASVYYPTVSGAKVTDNNGNVIKYSVINKDLISFETEIGKQYLISNLKPTVIPASPESLSLTENDTNDVKLTWSDSKSASKYRIYKATDNSPKYTLIGEAFTKDFTYAIDDEEKNSRITFAVTAVSESETESVRALCYRNPRVTTEYGIIPAKNSSLPFAVFENHDNEYSYVGSFLTYPEAKCAISKLAESDNNRISAVIYMTKNATVTKLSEEQKEGMLHENVTFDLAERTLVLSDPLFDIDTAKEAQFDFTVKNGKILTAQRSVLELYSSEKQSLLTPRKCSISFENVIFGRERSVNHTAPLFVLKDETDSNGLNVQVLLKNCTVDYLSTTETKQITLFDFAKESEDSVLSVKIEGGDVKLGSLNTLPLFNGKSDSRIVFTKNENGLRTSFKLTDDEAPELTFNTDNGEQTLKFVKRERVHFTRFTYYTLSKND